MPDIFNFNIYRHSDILESKKIFDKVKIGTLLTSKTVFSFLLDFKIQEK